MLCGSPRVFVRRMLQSRLRHGPGMYDSLALLQARWWRRATPIVLQLFCELWAAILTQTQSGIVCQPGCAAGEVEKKCYTVLAPGGTYAHIFNE